MDDQRQIVVKASPIGRSSETAAQELPTLRWCWLGFAFFLSKRKFVISWKRGVQTVHLTLSYGNASGELDLHLKREPPNPGQETYVPLARVPESMLSSIGEHMNRTGERYVRSIIDEWRPVRPGWLGRRGYSVMLTLDKNEFLDSLRAFVPQKHHRKHVLTFSPLKDPTYWRRFAEYIYKGEVLRYVGPDEIEGPVTATTIGRRRPLPTLVIGSLPRPDGRRGWMMIPQKRLTALGYEFVIPILDLLARNVGPRHAAIVETIIAELGLEEVIELADFVRTLRELFNAPREAVAKARRRAGLAPAGPGR